MCRVIAPFAAMFVREAASRPSPPHAAVAWPMLSAARRRLRTVHHRTLRWFNDPIAVVLRKRRYREFDPHVLAWALHVRTAELPPGVEAATKRVA